MARIRISSFSHYVVSGIINETLDGKQSRGEYQTEDALVFMAECDYAAGYVL